MRWHRFHHRQDLLLLHLIQRRYPLRLCQDFLVIGNQVSSHLTKYPPSRFFKRCSLRSCLIARRINLFSNDPSSLRQHFSFVQYPRLGFLLVEFFFGGVIEEAEAESEILSAKLAGQRRKWIGRGDAGPSRAIKGNVPRAAN